MLLVDLKSGPGEGVLAPGLLSAHILLLSSSEVWQAFLGSGYLIPDSRPTKLQSTELTGSNLSRHTWEPGSPITSHHLASPEAPSLVTDKSQEITPKGLFS